MGDPAVIVTRIVETGGLGPVPIGGAGPAFVELTLGAVVQVAALHGR